MERGPARRDRLATIRRLTGWRCAKDALTRAQAASLTVLKGASAPNALQRIRAERVLAEMVHLAETRVQEARLALAQARRGARAS